ncbi:MAG: hypothetical protein ACM3QS_17150 [Bacteroidota bacterium]
MRNTSDPEQMKNLRKRSHMPQGSLFFEKIVPILLIGMAVVMALLVLFAAGVLTGLIRF